jgi:hypothetical protein
MLHSPPGDVEGCLVGNNHRLALAEAVEVDVRYRIQHAGPGIKQPRVRCALQRLLNRHSRHFLGLSSSGKVQPLS